MKSLDTDRNTALLSNDLLLYYWSFPMFILSPLYWLSSLAAKVMCWRVSSKMMSHWGSKVKGLLMVWFHSHGDIRCISPFPQFCLLVRGTDSHPPCLFHRHSKLQFSKKNKRVLQDPDHFLCWGTCYSWTWKDLTKHCWRWESNWTMLQIQFSRQLFSVGFFDVCENMIIFCFS